MFAIIKNNKLIGFTDYKPTKKNFDFDNFIEGNFDLSKNLIYQDGCIIENNKNIEEKIKEINNNFDSKIKKYNSKYPVEEQNRFSDKLRKAEKIINGEEDYYIKKRAEQLCITPLEFAQKIIQKSKEFEQFYIDCENEKDLLISNL